MPTRSQRHRLSVQGINSKGETLRPSYDDAAIALFARMTVQPTIPQQIVMNDLIAGLKTDGVWTTLDALYVYASHDRQAAKLNWVQNLYNAVEVNSPASWTPKVGFAGNGTNFYMTTGFTPTTAAGKLTINSAHISSWSMTDNNGLYDDIGVSDGVPNHLFIRARNTGSFTTFVNTTTALTIAVANSTGLLTASRTASNLTTAYKNGVSIGTAATASVAMPNQPIGLLARLVNTTPTNPSINTVSVQCFGSSLDATKALALYNRINTYLTAISATTVWILQAGTWADVGIWDDANFWKDS